MPKMHNTRLQRSQELLRILELGPSSVEDREKYDLWFKTWVKRQLIDLIPELRKHMQETKDQTPPETPYSDGPMGHLPNVLPARPKLPEEKSDA